MIKTGGVGLAGLLNGGKAEEKVEVSLPSPTPSSNPGTVRDLGSCCTFCHKSVKCCELFEGISIVISV